MIASDNAFASSWFSSSSSTPSTPATQPTPPTWTPPKRLLFAAYKKLENQTQDQLPQAAPVQSTHQAKGLTARISENERKIIVQKTDNQERVCTIACPDIKFENVTFSPDGTLLLAHYKSSTPCDEEVTEPIVFEAQSGKGMWRGSWSTPPTYIDSSSQIVSKKQTSPQEPPYHSGPCTYDVSIVGCPNNDPEYSALSSEQQKLIDTLEANKVNYQAVSLYSLPQQAAQSRATLKKMPSPIKERVIRAYNIPDAQQPGWQESIVNCLCSCLQNTQETAYLSPLARKAIETAGGPVDQTMKDKQTNKNE